VKGTKIRAEMPDTGSINELSNILSTNGVSSRYGGPGILDGKTTIVMSESALMSDRVTEDSFNNIALETGNNSPAPQTALARLFNPDLSLFVPPDIFQPGQAPS
jgi:hypothetical protein